MRVGETENRANTQSCFPHKGAMKVSEFRQAMKELVEDYLVSPNFEIDTLFLAKAIVRGGR